MKRILLLDTNIASWPVYRYLESKGYDVFVAGNNPDDYLARICKNYINLDYGIVGNVEKLIRNQAFDAVIPGCNDKSYQVCSALNEQHGFLNIDAFDTSELINNKKRFREYAIESGLPTPRIIDPDKMTADAAFIVKPVDAYSGRGITVIEKYDRQMLDSAMKMAKKFSSSRECIIEEYRRGQLFSHSAFLVEQKIVTDFFVEEHCIASPFAVDTSWVVDCIPEKIAKKVRNSIEKMASSLSLCDGLIHTQFIVDGEELFLVEVTRRCPGDLYSLLIEYSTGIEYARLYVDALLGLNFNLDCPPGKINLIVRHTITLPQQKTFTALKFKQPCMVQYYFSLAKAGDVIAPCPAGRIGILFTLSDAESDFRQVQTMLLKRNFYDVL